MDTQDVERLHGNVEVANHATVDSMEQVTTYHVKLDRGSPALFIRYGRHQWVAKVGTREHIVENQKALHQLERLFQKNR